MLLIDIGCAVVESQFFFFRATALWQGTVCNGLPQDSQSAVPKITSWVSVGTVRSSSEWWVLKEQVDHWPYPL